MGSRASTDQVDAGLAMTVAVWLRKHGKLVKPKLTKQQRRDLRMCFELMDEDGSGRIDAEELGAAFKLLGVRATPTEVEDLLRMVDRQGTGDIGYQGFTQVMTNTMNKMDSSDDLEDDGGAAALQAAVPFEITASAYRRKKLIEALREGDRDLIASMAQGQEALKTNLEGTPSGMPEPTKKLS
ncbi:hypothetical protein WJX84_004965 [Apatococcus fuscideae]|uniref:EF-hand domain-containing protein n=1 Tax=Apatococcus fuscideae TaxID=2026836 RepID=A0AAW1SKS5_9CHLO